jgi:protein-S-isoprenylcysteine O-methyltransferase Ste14
MVSLSSLSILCHLFSLYCIFIQNKKASEEEKLLVEKFGNDYILYSKNKKKFIAEIF